MGVWWPLNLKQYIQIPSTKISGIQTFRDIIDLMLITWIFKYLWLTGVAVPAWNPSTRDAKARRSRVLGHPRLHCEFLSKKIPQSQNLVMTILSNLKLGREHRTSQIPDIQMWTIGYKRVQRHIILGIQSQCLTFDIETTDPKRSVSSYLLNML